MDGRTVDQLGSARSCIGACRPKTPHCSDHSIAGSIKGLMQKPRSKRPSIAASARPTRSLKGDLAHVEEPRWPDALSLVAALNLYSPDPPPPGL